MVVSRCVVCGRPTGMLFTDKREVTGDICSFCLKLCLLELKHKKEGETGKAKECFNMLKNRETHGTTRHSVY